MRRWLGVVSALFLSALVSGCAVPVGVTVASWAIDGFSYAATKKSLTDHGLSFIVDKDCALHRVVTEMDLYALCRDIKDQQDSLILVADADAAIEKNLSEKEVDDIFDGFALTAPSPSTPPAAIVADKSQNEEIAELKEPSIEEIANFETASGGQDQSDFEKLEDPKDQSLLNLKGIWQFIKSIPDFIT